MKCNKLLNKRISQTIFQKLRRFRIWGNFFVQYFLYKNFKESVFAVKPNYQNIIKKIVRKRGFEILTKLIKYWNTLRFRKLVHLKGSKPRYRIRRYELLYITRHVMYRLRYLTCRVFLKLWTPVWNLPSIYELRYVTCRVILNIWTPVHDPPSKV